MSTKDEDFIKKRNREKSNKGYFNKKQKLKQFYSNRLNYRNNSANLNANNNSNAPDINHKIIIDTQYENLNSLNLHNSSEFVYSNTNLNSSKNSQPTSSINVSNSNNFNIETSIRHSPNYTELNLSNNSNTQSSTSSNNLNEDDWQDVEEEAEIEKEYLYSESNTTLKEFALAILFYKLKHKISEVAINELMHIVKNILPTNNKCPLSYKMLKNQVKILNKITIYKICLEENCQSIQDLTQNIKFCSVCKIGLLTEFAVYGVKEQIQILLKNPTYCKQIKESNEHRKSKVGKFPIESALDGSIHLNLTIDKENERTLSVNINTDGAPLIKSRKFQMWPITGTWTELHPSSRESFTNVVLMGLWIHKKKPVLNKFFCKAFEELIELKNNPVILGT